MFSKKDIKSISINQDMLRLWGRRVIREIQNIPVLVFIKYVRWVNLGAAMAVLAAAVAIFIQVLYFDPPDVVEIPRTEQELQVQAIDNLEFWLEEREAERRKLLYVPQANSLLPPSEI